VKMPYILDVNPDSDALAWERDFLTRIEASVISCCGPDKDGGCPLLRGEKCGNIQAADGVLFQLNLDRPEHRRILAKYVMQLDVPIRVTVTPDQEKRWAHLLELVEVVTPPMGPAKLDAFAAEVESEVD